MFQLVLDDLLRERERLREELGKAVGTAQRSDFIDCWNLLDEIGEHDRRIAILMSMLELQPEAGGSAGTTGRPRPQIPARANSGERYGTERHSVHHARGRSVMGRRRLPLAGRR